MNFRKVIFGIFILVIFSIFLWYFIENNKNNLQITTTSISTTTNNGLKNKSFVMFNGYEVLTDDVKESEIYLPIWKQAFQTINGMTDEYFNSHIIVTGSMVKEFSQNHKPFFVRTFNVDYNWQFDWATTTLSDYFSFEKNGFPIQITVDKLSLNGNGEVIKNQFDFPESVWINFVKPIAYILAKDQIENIIKNITGSDITAEYHIEMGSKSPFGGFLTEPIGIPQAVFLRTIDVSKNDCNIERISMVTGEIFHEKWYCNLDNTYYP